MNNAISRLVTCFVGRLMTGVLVILLGIGLATTAHAQPQPDAPEDGSSAEQDDKRARELYLSGEADYAAGRYEQAADKFNQAYELSKRSALFFNIANAYERMGDYEQAAEYLKRYLSGPKVKDVVSVKERIRRLESAIDAREQEATPASIADGAADGVSDGVSDEPGAEGETQHGNDNRSRSRWPSYLLFSVSGLAVTGTVMFGLSANSAGRDVEEQCSDQSGTPVCLQAAKDAIDREKRSALFSDLSTGVAVITAAAGLYLLLRPQPRASRQDKRARVTPVLMPHGFGLGIDGSL